MGKISLNFEQIIWSTGFSHDTPVLLKLKMKTLEMAV